MIFLLDWVSISSFVIFLSFVYVGLKMGVIVALSRQGQFVYLKVVGSLVSFFAWFP